MSQDPFTAGCGAIASLLVILVVVAFVRSGVRIVLGRFDDRDPLDGITATALVITIGLGSVIGLVYGLGVLAIELTEMLP